MKKYKVRIKQAPQMDMGGFVPQYNVNPEMAYGGQTGFGLDLNSRRVYSDMAKPSSDAIGGTLAPVKRNEATYEAERNEVIVGDMDKDGLMEMLTYGGKPHSQGGTPANQEGFIFSNTRKMRIGGPAIEEFGKTAGKRYTPAELAKQYDLNRYKGVMDDPDADPITKRTAELMMENYNKKLGKLAIVQESMKGKPVPEFAFQAHPELAQKIAGVQEQQAQAQQEAMMAQEEAMMAQQQQMMMAAYGGHFGIPMMQTAGQAPKRVPVFDKDEMEMLNTLRGKNYDVNLPLNAMDTETVDRFTLADMQASRGKQRIYGDEDWNDDAHMADFAKRQKWFTDNAPNWDPRMPGATLAFQKAYDAERAKIGLKPYFGKGKKFQSYDDMFGEYTYSAPGLYERPATPGVDVPTVTTPPPVVTTPPADSPAKPATPGVPQPRLPYNGFDKLNLMTALSTPVKSYGPRAFLPDVQEMQGYYDQADYNPMLSQANTRMQMNNTFGNIGAAMAANTYNPELIQGLIGETQRARQNNLQTANSISQGNTAIRNQSNALNSQLMQDNYDKWVKTQEETDIANKLKWRKDVIPAAQNMVNNRINMQRYNMMYPEYGTTGTFWEDVAFKQGHKLGTNPQTNLGSQPSMEQFLSMNSHLKDIFAKGTNEEKLKVAALYQNFLKDRTMMLGKNPSNIRGNMQTMMNPLAAGYFGQDID